MHKKLLELSTDNKQMALAWYEAWFGKFDQIDLKHGVKESDTSLKFKARGIVEHDRRLISGERRVMRTQRTIDLLGGNHG